MSTEPDKIPKRTLDRLLRAPTNVGKEPPPPGRKHKNWLQAFVDYASIGEAPLTMYFWVGVSTIAGALRRRVWIDEVQFQWTPNFYIILVAPPGVVSKSTTASIGMGLLREVPGIHFGPDVVTWQALVQAMGASVEEFVIPSTGETKTMSAMTIESSELGNFLNPDDREQVDAMVSLWDNRKEFSKSTKTQGSDKLEHPWVNLIACTTPAWIAGAFPDYVIGGGLTSRCIFVYADKKRQYVPYLSDVNREENAALRLSLAEDLHRISLLCGEYTLTPEAKQWGREWYVQHYENIPKDWDMAKFGGYIARKQTHVHKLAIILAAAQRDELKIHLEDLKAAVSLVTSLEEAMPRVFEKIGIDDNARGQNELVRILEEGGEMKEVDVYKRLFRLMSYEDFGKAVASAKSAGLILLENRGGVTFMKKK